jgi:hypothetical protein
VHQGLTSRMLCRLVLLLACVSGGCSAGPSMKPFDVIVQPQITHGQGVPASFELNLVGVSDAELDQWKDYPVNRYWGPKDPLRKNADAVVMTFSDADPKPQTLARTDPVWQQWKARGVMNLVVMAFLPALPAPAAPAADPRKLVLPLDRRRWGDIDQILVLLTNAGLQTNATPHEP